MRFDDVSMRLGSADRLRLEEAFLLWWWRLRYLLRDSSPPLGEASNSHRTNTEGPTFESFLSASETSGFLRRRL